MAVVRVLGFVLLLCLSMVVEVESKILHGEQSLTEIADDDDDSPDTSINPHPATKKDNWKNVQRKNAVPRSLKKEQFSVEMVDESAQTKKTISSKNVVGNAMKNFGLLSKEETALVDQDVDNVLDYYGFGTKNGPKKVSRIKEPSVMAGKTSLIKNRVLNSFKISPKQKTQIPIQRAQHTMNFKNSLKSKMTYADVLNKKPNFILPGIAQKPQVLQAQTKKMPDLKLSKMSEKGSLKTKTQETYELQGEKNKINLSQQKNIIHYSPLQQNNRKLLASKHNIVKESGTRSGWLSVKDNINFYQDEQSQNPQPNMKPNVAKAAQDYMKMTNKDILKLVQNDQRNNGLNASRGGVDIAAPDWLPIKEKVHGIQFDVIQDDKMGPHAMPGMQDGMTGTNKNGQPNQVSGVQNGMAQRKQNGQPNQVGGVQNGMALRKQNGQPNQVSGVQNWMAQRLKYGQPNQMNAVQNDMSGTQGQSLSIQDSKVQNGRIAAQKNGKTYQQVNGGGVQNDMAQTQTNGETIPNNVKDKQKNEWLPINDNSQDPGVHFEMSRDGINSSSQINKNTELMNESLSSELTAVEGLNATASNEFGNITANDNITSKVTNFEDSAGNGQLQFSNISFKTNQNETLSNNSGVENILSHDQDTLNFTSLPNKTPNSNFKQLKNEKDVSKQVWAPGKVLHSHGHEVLRMTSWSPWSTCSETCGTNGLQIRTRQCMHAQNDDVPCNDSTIDWKWCASVDVCPESGLHIVSHDNNSTFANVVIEPNASPSKWGSWSACSKRCGSKSLRIRTRNCPGQRSKDTGVCVEPTMQWTWCQSIPCREPSNAAMKVSNQKRGRPRASGTILAHQGNGTTHPVIHTDDGLAFQDNCVVSSWSKWSKCSKSCGENSFKFRTRTCNCDYKQLCKSPTLQREHCKLKPCEGEENYGPWSPFSPCTKSCGGGWKKRTRRCRKDRGRHLCDQDLLIGVKVCNTHTCQKAANGVNKDSMVANVNPKSMCGFNPCAEFGCMDNPATKCLADTNCDPVFFNAVGHIDEKCRGWQRYEVKNPSLFCGFDPCTGSKCQRVFGRCLVDLNCKAFVLGADGTEIDCNMIQYPF